MPRSLQKPVLWVSGIDLRSIMDYLHTWEGAINAEW